MALHCIPFRKTSASISPALLCALALVGCGGGGGGGGADQQPTAGLSAEDPVAQTNSPNASGATGSTTAAAFAPSARIAGIELAQSLLFPSTDSALVLVSDKAVLVKVNVTTTNPAEAKPTGSVRVETSSGQLVQNIPLTAPTSALPGSVPQVPSFANSYTAVVPGNLVKAGLRLVASVDNGQSPTTINPRVGGGVAMQLVAVPVQIAGVTGQVVPGAASYVQARMPFASVTLRTRAPYVPTSVTSLPTSESAWRRAFSRILGELDDLHTLENAPDEAYYYGFVPKRTFGLAGLGYVPGNAALGFDVPNSPVAVRETMTHELGHNTSLPHAPCGGPANADPQYPYPNAQLGAPGRYIWGYNAETKAFVDPRRTDIHDIMSYCNGDTYSDYNYRRTQVYLTPTDAGAAKAGAATAVAAGPQELLLISGQIESGKLELTPLKTLMGEAKPSPDGPYTLRIVTAQGAVEYKFDVKQVDHITTMQRFRFTIPHPGVISSMTIVKDGAILMQSDAKATGNATGSTQKQSAGAAQPQVQATEQSGTLRLTWDAAQHPYLTVTHLGAQRSTLAQDLEGGTASLPLANVPAGGSFEFSLSDGMNTVRVTRNR
jgi:Peptidase M66